MCSTSDAEAARSQASLEILVEQLLQTNRGLCKRMRNLEDAFDARTISTNNQSDAPSLMSHGDTATITTSRRRKRNRIPMVETFRIRFTFDADLESSRVYSRVMPENSCDRSFNSSAVRTNVWSVFSGFSLADISVVSVVALPIYASDIRNQEHYLFGDFQAMQPTKKITPVQDDMQASVGNKYLSDLARYWPGFQGERQEPASKVVPELETINEIYPDKSDPGGPFPASSFSTFSFSEKIPDASILGALSLTSGHITLKDAVLKEQLSEIFHVQQMLEDHNEAHAEGQNYNAELDFETEKFCSPAINAHTVNPHAIQYPPMSHYVTDFPAATASRNSDRYNGPSSDPFENDLLLEVESRSETPESDHFVTGPSTTAIPFNVQRGFTIASASRRDSAEAMRPPCPICSGDYLNEGQILDLGKCCPKINLHMSL
jgi:hypothetical protein